ncbi:MAG: hypothetical protein GX779_06800, partial [Clostridia bacterium]|nr:hypothetical protein [Clostridia bacterium]
QLAELVRISTPLHLADYPVLTTGTTMHVFQIAMFLLFQAALNKTYKKAGKAVQEKPLIWVSVWTLAAYLIALSPFSSSWLVFIPMIICYYIIVRALFRVGDQLDDTGYVLTNAPVKISNGTFGWGFSLIALAIVIACSLYSNHLQLEARAYNPPKITEARQRLLDLDFPPEALQFLSDDDVELLNQAKDVEVFNKLLMFDPKKIERRESTERQIQITRSYEPGKKNMEVTTIFVEMPENLLYVMQYFSWQGGRPIWQDGLLIEGENKAEDKKIISSGLFYEWKGSQFIADFPRLVCDRFTYNTMFGEDYSIMIAGALSYPFGSERQGGYVLYRYTVKTDSDIFASHAYFSYVHLSNPLRIPYARTEDLILSGAYSFIDELQQHYTSYESLAYRKKN